MKEERYFLTNSPDGAILVVYPSMGKEKREALLKKGLETNDNALICKAKHKGVRARLNRYRQYSIPFKNPHPYYRTKIKIKKEITKKQAQILLNW